MNRRIRQELKSELKLVQLLSAPGEADPYEQLDTIDYAYWNSAEGLRNISQFADGIGPEKEQLIERKSGQIEPSLLHKEAKRLGLLIHPYTFRVDSFATFVNNYNELLNIYLNELEIDGLFSDFPDLTLNFIENRTNSISFSFIMILLGLVAVFKTLY